MVESCHIERTSQGVVLHQDQLDDPGVKRCILSGQNALGKYACDFFIGEDSLLGEGQTRRGMAMLSYLVKGSRARRFRQAGGSRQTEADGVLGCSRSCKFWCVEGRMIGAAWTDHGFFL